MTHKTRYEVSVRVSDWLEQQLVGDVILVEIQSTQIYDVTTLNESMAIGAVVNAITQDDNAGDATILSIECKPHPAGNSSEV